SISDFGASSTRTEFGYGVTRLQIVIARSRRRRGNPGPSRETALDCFGPLVLAMTNVCYFFAGTLNVPETRPFPPSADETPLFRSITKRWPFSVSPPRFSEALP